MRIDAIQLWSAAERGEDGVVTVPAYRFITFGLGYSDHTNPFIIEDASGLDMEDIIPQFVGGFYEDGVTDHYFDMLPKERLIALKLQLNPNFQAGLLVADLRDTLYRMISYSRTSLLEVRFMYQGTQVANVRGQLVKVESPQFTETPKALLNIACPFPLLRGPNYIQLAPDLEAPTPTLVDEQSTAPHGFRMKLTFIEDHHSTLNLKGKYGSTTWDFKIDKWFNEGDELYFSSERDNLYLYMIRPGDPRKDLSDKILMNQVWPIMFPGETQLWVTNDVTIDSLTYRPHYWGV